MTTVGEAIASLEQSLLIARETELEIFKAWLSDEDSAELLNVSGPPGVGKTTLLQCFAQDAEAQGKRVVSVDGHSFGATPQSFVAALSSTHTTDIEQLIAELNDTRSLVLVDTFEELEHLTGFLQRQLLPRLEMCVKVVIAGRRPLVLSWRRARGWQKIVKLLPIHGFSPSEGSRYLSLRGLEAGDLMEQIVRATGGNPLALSVAADIALQFGVRNFTQNSQWRLAAHSLVRRLLSEAADDPLLVGILEACSVVRAFDEATLAAMTGETEVSQAFDRLCRLSIVRPAPHGLMLHEHVRAIIAADHAWRQPLQHQRLRKRALDHFRERLRAGPADESSWLIAECFYLWGNTLIQELFFESDGVENFTVGPYTEADAPALRDLYLRAWDGKVTEDDLRLLEAALRFPGARLRVARTGGGAAVGFSTVVPLCAPSMRFLERHPVHSRLIGSYYVNGRRDCVPSTSECPHAHYLLHLVATGEQPAAPRSALLRDVAAIFANGGAYLSTTWESQFDQLMEACGFELLTETPNGTEPPAKGWVLDLSRHGFEAWIEAIMEGRRPRAQPDPVQLEAELLGALIHWNDCEWLAANCPVLAGTAPFDRRAPAIKAAIEDALGRARAHSSTVTEQAYRALELGYLDRRASHKAAICKLAVSRATFYRLCKRGVRALADELLASWRPPSAVA